MDVVDMARDAGEGEGDIILAVLVRGTGNRLLWFLARRLRRERCWLVGVEGEEGYLMYRLLSPSLFLRPSPCLQRAKEAGNDHDIVLQGEMSPITRDRDLGAQVPVEAEVEAGADLSILKAPLRGQETSLGRVADRQSLTTDRLLELLFLNLVREIGLVPGLRFLKSKYVPHLDHRQFDPS